jgi:glycerol-3-phosphate dehydrogenase (NAD(P)+)
VTKGLEVTESGEVLILPEILYTELPKRIRDKVYRVAIGGPCIAGELAVRRQTSIVFGSDRLEIAEELKRKIQTPYYHIKTTPDLLSLEICAALKNAYAMAVGFSLGWLDQQKDIETTSAMAHNMEAAIFATAIVEMDRFLQMLGADRYYAAGLPGAGDLFVTCQGGRSSRAGRLLGAGVSANDLQTHMPDTTLESVDVVKEIGKSFPEITARYNVVPEDFPLMSALIDVIVNNQPPTVLFQAFYPENQPNLR